VSLELVPELARRAFTAGVERRIGVGQIEFSAARVGTGERVRGQHAYDDAWTTIDAFLRMLEPRLAVVRDALSERGTLWLHLDHRTVHDAKVAADRVFGRRCSVAAHSWAKSSGCRGTAAKSAAVPASPTKRS
jgi:hypothetical protein